MKRLAFTYLMIIFALISSAQDLHFSDFYANPINTNPALCGVFRGNTRIISVLRDQYRAVTLPYQTFGIGFDRRKEKIFNTRNDLAFGGLINTDMAGDSRYGTYQIGIPLALHVYSPTSKLQFNYGILPSIVINTIDYTDLHYPEEFIDDQFDSNAYINEDESNTINSYFTLGIGINARYNFNEITGITIGCAAFNVNRPTSTLQGDKSVKNPTRLMLHAMFRRRISEWIELLPSAKFQQQGSFCEIELGGQIAKYFDNIKIQQIFAGCWYRAKQNDAIIANLGCEIGAFRLGASYDINTSNLQEASNNRGGIEFTITYIYTKKKSTKKQSIRCPGHF